MAILHLQGNKYPGLLKNTTTEIFQIHIDMSGGKCPPQQNDKCPPAIYFIFFSEGAGSEEEKSEERELGKEEDGGARGMAEELARNTEDPLQLQHKDKSFLHVTLGKPLGIQLPFIRTG